MLSSKFAGFNVHLIQDVKEFEKIKAISSMKVHIGVDTETSGLDHYKDDIAGVCIATGTGYDKDHYHGFYIPVRHIGYKDNLPIDKTIELVQFLVDNFTTVWWNRDFDATMLEKEGLVFPCVGKTHDAQCMAHLVKGDPYPALKDFAHDYLKIDVIHFSDNNAENNNFKTTDPTVSYVYAAQDAIITSLLGRKLWTDYQYIRTIYPIDNKFAECMRRIMYSTDLYLNKEKVEELVKANARELESVKQQIFSMVGYQFKLDSNVDKADALSRFVTLTVKTKSGKYKVDKEVLSSIDHPLAALLLKYANLTKFRSTYLLKMMEFPQPFHINYQHANVACLTENNLVKTMERGLMSIRDVEVGLHVLSENGYYPVTAKESFEDEVVKVTLRNGAFIEGNRKHPVLTADGQWTSLGDLVQGKRVTMCRPFIESKGDVILPEVEWNKTRRTKVVEFSKVLDTELASIIGFIDGDGSLVNDGVKLCFSEYEPEVEEYYTNLFAKRLNMRVPARYVGKDHSIQYKFCSSDISRWFKTLGVKPHGEELGIDVSQWGTEEQMAYVAALMDTDGSLASQVKPGRFNIILSMTSKGVIDNVVKILRFHGIDVHESVLVKGRKLPLYQIRVRSLKKYKLFTDRVGRYMHCSHKIERLKSIKVDCDYKYNRWAGKEDSSEVVGIETKGTKVVYDITVGTDHTFVANGIVTHNTGRLSSGTSKGNSFFAPFNIQNVPKVEVFRYLHYAPVSSSIKWVLDDSPYCSLADGMKVTMADGTHKILRDVEVGDQVMTNKGVKTVVDCGELKTVLKPYEGTRINKSGEWKYSVVLYEGKSWYLDLGEGNYTVTGATCEVQIRTLMTGKAKGGMRDCFSCPEGYVWLSADYSSQEMVLMANFSNEINLITPLLEGKDIHKHVATQMFGHYDPSHRTIAKIINFASNYGASGYTIGKRLGKSAEEGQELLNKYNNTLSALTRWKREMEKEGRRKGVVFTYFGRPRAVWMYYNSSNRGDIAFGDRTSVNTVVQGSGGDIIRIDHIKFWGMVDPNSKSYDKEFAENIKYAITVHDEINLFVKPEYIQQAFIKLKGLMEMKFPNWKVPLTVTPSIGVDWGHQIELKGFTESGEPIPDCTEDLMLLEPCEDGCQE